MIDEQVENPAVATRGTLSRSHSFWVAGAVAAVALWASAAPSLTYPLYKEVWSLTPAVTTAIFAIYPIVLVAALVPSARIAPAMAVVARAEPTPEPTA